VNSGWLTTLTSTLVIAGIVPLHAQIAVQNQGYVPFSDPPINYRSNDLKDPVTQLEHQLESGKTKLEWEPQHGYLRSVLQLLNVPLTSQTLVFSKTSFQYPKISPEHPRALYYNDDVYVGSVHDGKAIEIVSFDPMQGAIFYLLDEHRTDKPTFQRAELDCTQCHIAAGTRGIPGVLLRSVYPSTSGTLVPGAKTFITDQESPWNERWGGWYVTGNFSGAEHMGNATAEDKQLHPFPQPFNASSYLAPDSDVVAHLVLAHQTQMHNLITLTNYKTRLGQPFEKPAEQLLRYLLFSNEAILPAPLGTSSSFAKQFPAREPRDSKGRSLRDLDLRTRIFRYPCSYLIYSDSFDALPEPAKRYVYHRLLEVLSGKDQSADFAQLTNADRQAILEILLETKHGLPGEWRTYAKTAAR